MKPSIKTEVEESISLTGTSQESNYKVAKSGMIFHIISSGLYTDGLGAAIKETITNAALDSHSAKGCPDRPIFVTLPTPIEPMFKCRDYGISMTHETVENVFGIIGESTKKNSDTDVGGFGVGGKSPWAYTDVFTIRAFLNGSVRTYINEYNNHCPKLELISEEATEEEDGVEISFAVQEKDIDTVHLKFAQITQFLPTRPKTNIRIDYPEIGMTKLTDSASIASMEHSPCHQKKHPIGYYAVVGGIIYPVSPSSAKVCDAPYVSSIVNHGKNPLIMNLAVSDVDVKPSREVLDYETVKTCETINKVLCEADAEIKKRCEEFSNRCNGMKWMDAYNLFKEEFKHFGNHRCLGEKISVETSDLGKTKLCKETHYRKVCKLVAERVRKEKTPINTLFRRLNQRGGWDRVCVQSQLSNQNVVTSAMLWSSKDVEKIVIVDDVDDLVESGILEKELTMMGVGRATFINRDRVELINFLKELLGENIFVDGIRKPSEREMDLYEAKQDPVKGVIFKNVDDLLKFVCGGITKNRSPSLEWFTNGHRKEHKKYHEIAMKLGHEFVKNVKAEFRQLYFINVYNSPLDKKYAKTLREMVENGSVKLGDIVAIDTYSGYYTSSNVLKKYGFKSVYHLVEEYTTTKLIGNAKPIYVPSGGTKLPSQLKKKLKKVYGDVKYISCSDHLNALKRLDIEYETFDVDSKLFDEVHNIGAVRAILHDWYSLADVNKVKMCENLIRCSENVCG